jgi:hypothetical protein
VLFFSVVDYKRLGVVSELHCMGGSHFFLKKITGNGTQWPSTFIAFYQLTLLLVCVLLFLFLSFSCQAQIPLGEKLDYTVSYNGFASGYHDLVVADASFTTEPAILQFQDESAYEMKVSISSKAYSMAEKLFKARFSYRSLLNEQLDRTLLVEHLNKGKKLKHRVIWFDWKTGIAEMFKVRRKKRDKTKWFSTEKWWVFSNESIPLWLLENFPEHKKGVPYFRSAGKGKLPITAPTYDQLSATYLFRNKTLEVGKQFEFQICTGKKIVKYALTVAKEESVLVGQQLVSAFKIIIDTKNLPGVFAKSDKSSLIVWVDQSDKHVPLKYEASVLYGTFVISLKSL